MNIFEFSKRFPDEAACREYMRLKREQAGITCKRCPSFKHYWLENLQKWECSSCKSRTNLRAGTMMEHSKLPVLTWFKAIHLITTMKKSYSVLALQEQLEMKRYEPVWLMVQKIRMAMGNRDEKYELKGEIEMDDAFFEIVDLPKKDELGNIIKDEEDKNKRGRGSNRQAKVLVMVESKPNPGQRNKNRKNRSMGFVKMIVVDLLTNDDINYIVRRSIHPESKVITDGFQGYSRLNEVVNEHERMIVPAKEAHKKLPWVHTVISNAKRLFLGTHHSIKKEYLQNYLNEFCYKLNRRNFETDLFDRLVIAGVEDRWY